MLYILFFTGVFLIGSIPFGLIIGHHWLKLDIRKEGSGNIGMTNVMRVGGKWAGILTFLLDFGKGAFSKTSKNAPDNFPLSMYEIISFSF